MATLTAEQIEQKKQQLKQLAEEAKQLKDELVEAGAWPLDEDELDQAAGGIFGPTMAEGKTEQKNEEQLQEEQLDEVNGGAGGMKNDNGIIWPEDIPTIPDPLTVAPAPQDPAIVQKLMSRIRSK